jgi:hypothetical protein
VIADDAELAAEVRDRAQISPAVIGEDSTLEFVRQRFRETCKSQPHLAWRQVERSMVEGVLDADLEERFVALGVDTPLRAWRALTQARDPIAATRLAPLVLTPTGIDAAITFSSQYANEPIATLARLRAFGALVGAQPQMARNGDSP